MEWIVLLRGVNVGKHAPRVTMPDLRQFALDLGFKAPRTLLQSGNLIFDGDESHDAGLEGHLETEAAKRLGVNVDFLVRSGAEWRAAIACNPFVEAAETDPGHLLVYWLKAEPAEGAVEDLRGGIIGREQVQLCGRQAYIVFPDGVGHSRLTTTVIEKRLGVRVTGRNWNTVQKIADMMKV